MYVLINMFMHVLFVWECLDALPICSCVEIFHSLVGLGAQSSASNSRYSLAPAQAIPTSEMSVIDHVLNCLNLFLSFWTICNYSLFNCRVLCFLYRFNWYEPLLYHDLRDLPYHPTWKNNLCFNKTHDAFTDNVQVYTW